MVYLNANRLDNHLHRRLIYKSSHCQVGERPFTAPKQDTKSPNAELVRALRTDKRVLAATVDAIYGGASQPPFFWVAISCPRAGSRQLSMAENCRHIANCLGCSPPPDSNNDHADWFNLTVADTQGDHIMS